MSPFVDSVDGGMVGLGELLDKAGVDGLGVGADVGAKVVTTTSTDAQHWICSRVSSTMTLTLFVDAFSDWRVATKFSMKDESPEDTLKAVRS